MAIKAIVNAYVRRIYRGSITVDDVPEEICNDVKAALKKNKTGGINYGFHRIN